MLLPGDKRTNNVGLSRRKVDAVVYAKRTSNLMAGLDKFCFHVIPFDSIYNSEEVESIRTF